MIDDGYRTYTNFFEFLALKLWLKYNDIYHYGTFNLAVTTDEVRKFKWCLIDSLIPHNSRGITIGLTVRLEGTPEGLIKILNYCKAQFILVEDSTQVERLLQVS